MFTDYAYTYRPLADRYHHDCQYCDYQGTITLLNAQVQSPIDVYSCQRVGDPFIAILGDLPDEFLVGEFAKGLGSYIRDKVRTLV
jgi:hypothetical protein